MATVALGPATDRPWLTSNWIIGPAADLTLVIGGSLAGFLMLAAYSALHLPAVWLWWIWSVGFDGTHIFGMASRTFFDRDSWAREGKLLLRSLVLFFSLGPLLVLLGMKGWLALFVGVWAYYHVVRQHFGFLMLYKVKNADMAPADNAWDARLLYLMLAFPPFYRFFVHHPEELGLPEGAALAGMSPWIEPALWGVIGLTCAGYLHRQVRRQLDGIPFNVPKMLLLGGVISLHWLTFHFLSWEAAVPTVTIAHNLQYHAIVWLHNRNKYAPEADGRRRFGRIPMSVSRSVVAYILIGLAFSLLYRVPGYSLQQVSDLAFGFFAGFGLTHYYVDSKIWRVRNDPGLRKILGLEKRQ